MWKQFLFVILSRFFQWIGKKNCPNYCRLTGGHDNSVALSRRWRLFIFCLASLTFCWTHNASSHQLHRHYAIEPQHFTTATAAVAWNWLPLVDAIYLPVLFHSLFLNPFLALQDSSSVYLDHFTCKKYPLRGICNVKEFISANLNGGNVKWKRRKTIVD